MSIPINRKFRISLKPESAKGQPDGKGGKTQGLRTGDIVRRQYFDGNNVIYSLMCVLDYGVENVYVEEAILDSEGNYILLSEDPIEYKTQVVSKQQPWFIGLLLEGDVPMPGEVLDFVRITNLFDQSRSGAMYLTASDEESPFMDVIDGIGRNCSLTWPENINNTEIDDPQSQYIVTANQCEVEYIPEDQGRSRICRIKKLKEGSASIKQTFNQYIQNPNQVLIAFWAKASSERTIKINLSYVDESRTDGEIDVKIGGEWTFHLYRITVDYSGRHRRAININLDSIQADEYFYISDFNAILLSSVANYGEASQIRVGKLSGISDPVFGKLDSYGGYFQKLFASNSAHISGTLTAGDENGFAATFYAGKIHKNAFINSIEPETDVPAISDADLMSSHETLNPTGMGQVFEVSRSISMRAQSLDWLYDPNRNKVGNTYTFSFWAYCKCAGQLTVLQNAKVVGVVQIPHQEVFAWHRQKVSFKLLDTENEDMVLSVVASYQPQTGDMGNLAEMRMFLFSAPQLEAGNVATQYQPTDEIVTHLCEDYGAWFNRGGIGGTIQNPLLRLNYDGSGAIDTRTNSFRLNQDGSGYLANKNINWDSKGKVTFGKDVTLNWDNLGKDAQDEMANRYMRILGQDIFTIIGQEDSTTGKTCSPASIILRLEEVGFASISSQRQWYLQIGDTWVPIPGADGTTLEVFPDSCYWLGYVSDPPTVDEDGNPLTYHGESRVSFQCVVSLNESRTYTDTFNITKQYVQGYSVMVTSSRGNAFQNGICATILTATVYYQGQPVNMEYALEHFTFTWHRYKVDDLSTDLGFEDLDITEKDNVLALNYNMDGSDVFVCELGLADHFDYSFPIIF